MAHDFQADIDAIGAMDAVPTLLRVICEVTGMGFAAVARVTEKRWVCLAVNDQINFGLLPGGELEVESTLCHDIRQNQKAILIDHVTEDATYCGHHTPQRYGFESYVSVPIFLADGTFFGTLCAIDPKPASVNNARIQAMFRHFADLIGSQLDSAQRLARAEANLLDAEAAAKLREQFIAILGHDLRNPLASIGAGAQLLRKEKQEAQRTKILEAMTHSINRMAALVDNLMDFARGRLGGGFALQLAPHQLAPVVQQIVDEIRSVYPNRTIQLALDLGRLVVCDRGRIGQVLSNLLGNALAYGTAGEPIRVRATAGDVFELSVTNEGAAITPEIIERLFQPFSRGAVEGNQSGLGLGLYIVAEIARAHGGSVAVASEGGRTCFTVTIPQPTLPAA